MSSPIGPGRFKKLRFGERPPHVYGVYRLLNRTTGYIDYIGITSNLYDRFANHKSSHKHFNQEIHDFEYKETRHNEWEELQNWEIEKIAKHNPGLNITRGGNGRRPRVNGIEVPPGQSLGDVITDNELYLSTETIEE